MDIGEWPAAVAGMPWRFGLQLQKRRLNFLLPAFASRRVRRAHHGAWDAPYLAHGEFNCISMIALNILYISDAGSLPGSGRAVRKFSRASPFNSAWSGTILW
ncbi:MAG TPA: hypothetical protein VMV48_14175 [Gallionellaceae bacterium]|nr:hypothetical protein [Gallionellaceae bacterium]